MTITIRTAADFIDRGYQLREYCRACPRSVLVDLSALAPSTVLAGPQRVRFRCSVCGSSNAEGTVVAPTWWSVRR